MATIRVRFLSTLILTVILSAAFLGLRVQSANAAPLGVINGSDVAEGEQLWMVGLLLADVDDVYNAQFCGGTLIDAEWVMTAAHCTFDLDLRPFAAKDLEVMAGSHQLQSGTGVRVAVDRIVRHHDFDFTTYHNDIALLHLVESLADLPVVLMDNDRQAIAQTEAVGTARVFGWGVTEDGVGATALKSAELPVVLHKTCADFYQEQGYNVAASMLCAGYFDGGIDACAGDSGGPLMVWQEEQQHWYQVGIVSAGAGCAEPGYYGLYTAVADYRDWIEDVTNPFTMILKQQSTSTLLFHR